MLAPLKRRLLIRSRDISHFGFRFMKFSRVIDANSEASAMPAVVASRTQYNEQMFDALKRHILRERQKKKEGKSKSLSNEAANVLLHKDRLVNLQSICLQQEIEINEVRKRTVVIKERKMLLDEEKTKLEIELLKKQLEQFPNQD